MLDRKAFTTVAENLGDAIVITDPEGRITWTNQAFHDLCGYTKKEVLTRKPGSFLQGPETDPETVVQIREAIRRGDAIDAELLNYHKNGRPYWVSIRITPWKDRRGSLQGFLAFERETTIARMRQNSLEHQVAELYSVLLDVVDATADTPDVVASV